MDISDLQKLCDSGAIKWTAHMVARLQERGTDPSDIKNCIMTGRIIEDYPDDYPYPSCLILGNAVAGKELHAVIGLRQGYLWLITAYYPDPLKWNEDFSIRKEREE